MLTSSHECVPMPNLGFTTPTVLLGHRDVQKGWEIKGKFFPHPTLTIIGGRLRLRDPTLTLKFKCGEWVSGDSSGTLPGIYTDTLRCKEWLKHFHSSKFMLTFWGHSDRQERRRDSLKRKTVHRNLTGFRKDHRRFPQTQPYINQIQITLYKDTKRSESSYSVTTGTTISLPKVFIRVTGETFERVVALYLHG